MRRTTLNILTILILIILLLTGCAKQDKFYNPNVNKRKVNKFIKKIGKLYSNTFTEEQFNKIKKVIKSSNLNEEEYIYVQNYLSEQLDERYFFKRPKSNIHDKDDLIKFHIVSVAKSQLLIKWEEDYTNEEIVSDKILPILENSNDKLKLLWLFEISNRLMDIKNKRLPFSNKNRIKTLDTLINIFLNKENYIEIKWSAFDAWTYCEEREEKIYYVFDILSNNDPELFESVQFLIVHLCYKAPKLYDMMLEILENRSLYSEKVLICSLNFFEKDEGYNRDDKIERLKKVLKDIIETEKNKVIREHAEKILELIENREHGD